MYYIMLTKNGSGYILAIFSQTRLVTLRPILNFAPRSKLRLPGAKLSPRGEFCPPRGEFFTSGGEILCSPVHSSKQKRVLPPGGNKGVNIPPRGQSSPLGDSLHPWGPGVKLRMAICFQHPTKV
jgi:hypothetical protein